MDDRHLIFSNLLNGVPVPQVARDFHKSEAEVEQVFTHVLRKVKSYCFLRSRQKNPMPVVTASTVAEARAFRLTCLSVLPKLNLDRAPEFRDIHTETITPDNIMTVARNLSA